MYMFCVSLPWFYLDSGWFNFKRKNASFLCSMRHPMFVEHACKYLGEAHRSFVKHSADLFLHQLICSPPHIDVEIPVMTQQSCWIPPPSWHNLMLSHTVFQKWFSCVSVMTYIKPSMHFISLCAVHLLDLNYASRYC